MSQELAASTKPKRWTHTKNPRCTFFIQGITPYQHIWF